VSLKSALKMIPDDRATRTAVESVVRYLHAHRAFHVDADRIVSETRLDPAKVEMILNGLVKGGVLDSVGDPPSYRFVDDRVLRIETDLFLRPSHSHTEALQSNVERFRRLYGGH
jgi:hypothetical protein